MTTTAAQEATGGAGELLKRQEELEKKAAELDRREREMQSLSASGGASLSSHCYAFGPTLQMFEP